MPEIMEGGAFNYALNWGIFNMHSGDKIFNFEVLPQGMPLNSSYPSPIPIGNDIIVYQMPTTLNIINWREYQVSIEKNDDIQVFYE